MLSNLCLFISVIAPECEVAPPLTDDPPPCITVEPGKRAVRLEVQANLVHPDGTPWTTPVLLDVVSTSTGVSASTGNTVTTPDAQGDIDAFVYVAEETAFDLCHVSIWGDPDAHMLFNQGPFLEAAQSVASHHVVTPVGDCDVGASFPPVLGVMAEAPMVGTFGLSSPATATTRMCLADGDLARFRPGWKHDMPWTVTPSIGQTDFSLYSWSSVGFWDCVLVSQFDFPYTHERIRRNSSNAELELREWSEYEIHVSSTAFPEAAYVMIVRTEHHHPNGGIPQGSDVDFVTQSDRAIGAVSLVPGLMRVDDATLYTHSPGVLEVWGWSGDPDDDPFLLTYTPVSGAPGSHQVSL